MTSRNVEFVIVGAHALAFHGVARYTHDLDLWIRMSEENAENLRLALQDFGITLPNESVQRLLGPRKVIQFGHETSQIEILNFLDGCKFDVAISRADHAVLGGVSVTILSLADYVLTKKASGRPKHFSDLDLLRSMIGPLPDDNPSN